MAGRAVRVLLVEDDASVRVTVRDALLDDGYTVECCSTGTAALATLERDPFDILLSDIRLPGCDGVTLFHRARVLQPLCAVILMTAYGKIDDAVDVVRAGAADYVVKPFEIDELLLRIERLAEDCDFRRQMVERQDPLVGSSARMQAVLRRLQAAAEAGVNVLVTGETGTGKELAAQVLHQAGDRASKPLVQLNCSAIPTELFEAEMFGHERGAFTGAHQRKAGLLAQADGGTLFLDEVGELAPEHQAKLLRVLDGGVFRPVGGSQQASSDVRVVAATNRDLRSEVEAGNFRRDLYYRLNVIEVSLPPLRERKSDIPELLATFLGRIVRRRNLDPPMLSASAIAALLAYDYPGNVRELLHAIEYAVALSRGSQITVEHLPEALHKVALGLTEESGLPLHEATRHFERIYIEQTLDASGGKRVEAARRLGISRKSLWQKARET